MTKKHSAEWLRGAVAAINRYNTSHYESLDDIQAEYRARLAEAEAVLQGEKDLISKYKTGESEPPAVEPGWSDAIAYAIAGKIAPGTLTITNGRPDTGKVIAKQMKPAGHIDVSRLPKDDGAAEVIEACREALIKARPYVNGFGLLHRYAWGDNSMSDNAKAAVAAAKARILTAADLIAAWEAAQNG